MSEWRRSMPAAAEASQLKRGEAGRAGGDVRSDMHVTVEERASGGIEIDLQSRVALYYGENVRLQVRELLRTLGVEHAYIRVVDEGALPFVIAARVEAALERAGLGRKKLALPDPIPPPAASAKDRLRRSRLYLPGNEPKYFINAGLHGRSEE